MHVDYFHHTCDSVKYTSLDVLSHCGWSGPVSQLMASGTRWLTVGVFPINTTSVFNALLDFPNFEFIKLFYSIPSIKPISLSQLSQLLALYAMDPFRSNSVLKFLQFLWFRSSCSPIVRIFLNRTGFPCSVYSCHLDCLDPTESLLRLFQMSMKASRSFQMRLTDFWSFKMRLTSSRFFQWILGLCR